MKYTQNIHTHRERETDKYLTNKMHPVPLLVIIIIIITIFLLSNTKTHLRDSYCCFGCIKTIMIIWCTQISIVRKNFFFKPYGQSNLLAEFPIRFLCCCCCWSNFFFHFSHALSRTYIKHNETLTRIKEKEKKVNFQ